MKRRGFFSALGALFTAPLALAMKVAKPKRRWLKTKFHMTDAEFIHEMIPGMADLEYHQLVMLVSAGRRSGKSTLMTENFRRAYGRRV